MKNLAFATLMLFSALISGQALANANWDLRNIDLQAGSDWNIHDCATTPQDLVQYAATQPEIDLSAVREISFISRWTSLSLKGRILVNCYDSVEVIFNFIKKYAPIGSKNLMLVTEIEQDLSATYGMQANCDIMNSNARLCAEALSSLQAALATAKGKGLELKYPRVNIYTGDSPWPGFTTFGFFLDGSFNGSVKAYITRPEETFKALVAAGILE